MATVGWTDHAQRPIPAGASYCLYLPTGNNFTANKAITLLIERLPFPIAIEPLQNLELLGVREFDGRKQGHRDGSMAVTSSLDNQPNGESNYR